MTRARGTLTALLVVAAVLLVWGSSGAQPLLRAPDVVVGTFGLNSPAFEEGAGSQPEVSEEPPTEAQRDRAGWVADAYLLLYACFVIAGVIGLVRLVVLSPPALTLTSNAARRTSRKFKQSARRHPQPCNALRWHRANRGTP